MPRSRSPLLWLTFVTTLASLPAAPAMAGSYTVASCGGQGPAVNNAWTPAAGQNMSAYTDCPQHGSGNEGATGIVTRNEVTPSGSGRKAAWLDGAYQTFVAPAGTGIGRVTATTSIRRFPSGNWSVGFFGWNGDTVASFFGASLLWGNASGDSGGGAFEYNGIQASFNAGGRTRVRLDTRCGDPAGCLTDWLATDTSTNRSHLRAYATMTNVAVQVVDDVLPAVAGSGDAWNGGWQRLDKSVRIESSDSTGIKAVSTTLDGVPVDARVSACDYTQRAPCPNRVDELVAIRRSTADGPHVLAVNALDTADNLRSSKTTVYTDNHSPGRPEAIAVEGGEGWRSTNDFAVRWTNPGGQVSPIVRATYRICAVANPSSCTTESEDGMGLSRVADIHVPDVGAYTVKVSLEDWAGNSGDDAASDPVTLRFDDTVPAEAVVPEPKDWLNPAEAAAFGLTVTPDAATPPPPSGIAGYSITSDGSSPDATIDLPGTVARLQLPPLKDGPTTVRARAVTGAGVPAQEVGSAVVRVDTQAPSVAAGGAPDAHTWQRTPVALAITGTDQDGLSALEGDVPTEKGGWVAYRVDGAAPARVRGAAADITVDSDGVHTVTFAATDRAGNVSTERAAGFRIDATPPDTLGFEPSDPDDPRRVSAIASDRTSGIAGGEIELRRAGTRTWKELATTASSGRLVARLDDEALPRGAYLFRVRARDRAGNQRVTDRILRGSRAEEALVLDVPVRLQTRLALTAARRPITRLSCRSVRSNGRTVRRCRRVTLPAPASGPVQVTFGATAALSGRLTTVDGAPLSGAALTVSATDTTPGAAERSVGSARTDAAGRFTFRAPPGPSRALRVRYGGSELVGASQAGVLVAVPAGVTLSVDRRSVRNGSSVAFRGRLLGQPIPLAGKVVTLQAFYRGRWRAFATVRTTPAGRFVYRYRFEATRGRVTYRFRAQSQPEPSYPYELGSSAETRVTVTG